MSRAAPTRAAVNLAQVDTGATQHNLYVKVVPAGDPDAVSANLTRQVLMYVSAKVPDFQRMGIRVNVQRVRAKDLKNPRLVDAMKKRGIRNLPALTTPNNVYLGVKEIVDIYQKNLAEFAAFHARGTDGGSHRDMDRPEEALDEYYRSDMTQDHAEADASDEGIGDSDTSAMMSAYSRMMTRRTADNKDRKGASEGRAPAAAPARRPAPSSHSAAPHPAPSSRPDNVYQEGDDAEITGMIDRINQELQGSDTANAFTHKGGDSLEGDDDEGGGDPADRLMEKSFWGNQEESLR